MGKLLQNTEKPGHYADGVIIWELDLKTNEYKRRTDKSFDVVGYSTENWSAHVNFLADHNHPDNRDWVDQKFAEAKNGIKPDRYEYRMISGSGKIVWLQTNLYPEFLNGEVAYVRGVSVEITNLKHAEIENTHFLALSRLDLDDLKIERSFREKFINTLTHDLRKPLASIKAGAQLMLRCRQNEQLINELGARDLGAVNRADKMTQDLLDTKRVRDGTTAANDFIPFNLAEIAENSLNETSLVHGNRFRFDSVGEVVDFWNAEGCRR